jgi:TPR repeat protein
MSTIPNIIPKNLLFQFPASFYEQIDHLNKEKTKEAPIALVLEAQKDNGALHESQSFFLTIAKTHKIFIETISKKEELKSKIDACAKKNQKLLNSVVLLAHGNVNEDGVELSEKNEYTSNDVKEEDFQKVDAKGKIFLFSCDGGKKLGPQIATSCHRIVDACPKIMHQYLSFSYCNHHQHYEMKQYDPNPDFMTEKREIFNPITEEEIKETEKTIDQRFLKGQQNVYTYENGKKPECCNEAKGYETFLKYFSDSTIQNRNHSFNVFANGSAEDLFLEGMNWRLNGLMLVPFGYEEEAILFFEKAAMKNHFESQFQLGFIYEENKQFEKAINWYQKAAKGGHLQAQYRLGIIYEYQKKWDLAEQCYQKVTENPNIRNDNEYLLWAQFRLGIVYKYQKKWDLAAQYFQKVTENQNIGNNDEYLLWAPYFLGIVYKTQGKWELAKKSFQMILKKHSNYQGTQLQLWKIYAYTYLFSLLEHCKSFAEPATDLSFRLNK